MKRFRSASRLSQLRLHLLSSSAEKPGVFHADNLSSGKLAQHHAKGIQLIWNDISDDSIADSSRSWPVETPESALRGPRLPGLGETVLSPALMRPAALDDNPGSGKRQRFLYRKLNLDGLLSTRPFIDDSAQIHSSPIRGHVDRKLSRTVSGSTAGSGRDPSDELQEAVQIAYGNLDGVTSLDSDQLAKLRQMITALSSKVDDAISGNSMRA